MLGAGPCEQDGHKSGGRLFTCISLQVYVITVYGITNCLLNVYIFWHVIDCKRLKANLFLNSRRMVILGKYINSNKNYRDENFDYTDTHTHDLEKKILDIIG